MNISSLAKRIGELARQTRTGVTKHKKSPFGLIFMFKIISSERRTLVCYNTLMAITEMFLWWYAHGWLIFIKHLRSTLTNITDFFSMSSLVRTLFKPYRQISANSASNSASLDLRFHMFLDRLISRAVGFVSRLVLLIAGTAIIVIGGVFSIILIILWPLIPILPTIGIILTVTGFTL